MTPGRGRRRPAGRRPSAYAAELVVGRGRPPRARSTTLLGRFAKGWTLERMPAIDRACCGIGHLELRTGPTCPWRRASRGRRAGQALSTDDSRRSSTACSRRIGRRAPRPRLTGREGDGRRTVGRLPLPGAAARRAQRPGRSACDPGVVAGCRPTRRASPPTWADRRRRRAGPPMPAGDRAGGRGGAELDRAARRTRRDRGRPSTWWSAELGRARRVVAAARSAWRVAEPERRGRGRLLAAATDRGRAGRGRRGAARRLGPGDAAGRPAGRPAPDADNPPSARGRRSAPGSTGPATLADGTSVWVRPEPPADRRAWGPSGLVRSPS